MRLYKTHIIINGNGSQQGEATLYGTYVVRHHKTCSYVRFVFHIVVKDHILIFWTVSGKKVPTFKRNGQPRSESEVSILHRHGNTHSQNYSTLLKLRRL
jgi:hypothetical protein